MNILREMEFNGSENCKYPLPQYRLLLATLIGPKLLTRALSTDPSILKNLEYNWDFYRVC